MNISICMLVTAYLFIQLMSYLKNYYEVGYVDNAI